MVIKIVFFESALELIPESLRKHPLIIQEWEKNVKQKNRGVLLDGGFHRPLIDTLEQAEKRGRPDIVHHSLLNITYSPLFRKGEVQVIIHTRDNLCIKIPSNWRVPVNYNRFCGLFSQLLLNWRVPLSGEPLLKVEHSSLFKLLKNFNESRFYLCQVPKTTNDLNYKIINEIPYISTSIFLIGGFQHGEIEFIKSKQIEEIDLIPISLYKEAKPAWVITAKIISLLEMRSQEW